jgi:hypothetical protein
MPKTRRFATFADWFVKFKITDPSSGSGAMDPDLLPHTEVMCFAKDAETLPQFEYGNIIRLHRAKVSASVPHPWEESIS